MVEELDMLDMRNESKEEAFRRLASQRTDAVLERIRILGNCSNRSHYQYTPDDVDKIVDAILNELVMFQAKFSDTKRRPVFTL